jgi:hypothetical protein
MWILIILVIIAFLLMEHPIAFWLILVPLGLMFILSLMGFFKSKRAGLSELTIAMVLLVAFVVALVIIVV